MIARDTGGLDADGLVYDANWFCEECDTYYSWPVTPGLAANEDPLQTEMLAIIAEHDTKGCPGLTAENAPFVELPRDLYFKAEDHALKTPGIRKGQLDVIQNLRYSQLRRAMALLDDLGSALKVLKAFDQTGNIGNALGHIQTKSADLKNAVDVIVADVEDAEARHREAAVRAYRGASPTDSAAVVEPTPQAPAAADPAPKPGPHLVGPSAAAGSIIAAGLHGGIAAPGLASVHVFNPAASPKAELAAFDRVVAARAAMTPRIVR